MKPPQVPSASSALPEGPVHHFIAGEPVHAVGTASLEVRNPATGEVIAEGPEATPEVVDAAVGAASTAYASWSRMTPGSRAEILYRLAAVIDAHVDTIAALESVNVGKPLSVARDEVLLASDAVRFFAGAARATLAPSPGRYAADHTSLVVREPVGVVAGIVPWNYPFLTAVWKIAPALAAGNCIVIKPSELTPLSILEFARLTADVLPPGVVNVVVGTGAGVGAALAAHEGVAMVSLTGSTAAGEAVMRAASSTVKRVHLELGGKAPVVVFDDADLSAAVEAVVSMGFWNAGQECGAATRVLVQREVLAEFVDALVGAVGAISLGDPSITPEFDVGPLISEAHRDRVDGLVRRARSDGARVLCGGAPADRPGYFYLPTVIDRVTPGSEIDRVEIFGPVVTVGDFVDEADAIGSANDSQYGLSASVWTRDSARALRLAHAIDAGTVWVNSHLALATEMPWGGFKRSGTGRDLSTLGLDDYSRTKHVMIATS